VGAGSVVGKSSALSAELRGLVPLVLSVQADKTRQPRPLDLGVFVVFYLVEYATPRFLIARGQHEIRASKKAITH
jgi:hypothetical protein